jgi:acetyl-CoA carboxylase biotin carboxyl carrier protein
LNLKELKEILQILEEKEITEFELEEEGIKLRIRKAARSGNNSLPAEETQPPVLASPAGAAPDPAPIGAAPHEPAPPLSQPAGAEAGLVLVKSPIVGTFYRAADPNSAPFVNVGDRVRVGQVLCIIEAMKLTRTASPSSTASPWSPSGPRCSRKS